ncbi:hypothetical protein D3C75_521320 [compost metagenome]
MLVLTAASALRMVSGSNRLRKCGMDFSLMYKPSAMKIRSSLPSSAFCTHALYNSKFTLASGLASEWRHIDVLPPTPCSSAPSFSCFGLVMFIPPKSFVSIRFPGFTLCKTHFISIYCTNDALAAPCLIRSIWPRCLSTCAVKLWTISEIFTISPLKLIPLFSQSSALSRSNNRLL